MQGNRAVTITVAAALFALGLAGLAQTVAARSGARPTVSLRSTSLGRVLVDRSGRTLYLFERDRHGRSTCKGACAGVWPAYTVSGRLHAGKGVSARKLGTVKRAGGKRQVTYAGHPLYRYAGDSRRGDTNGEGVLGFGARWYVVAASGRRILPSQPAQPPAPSPMPSPAPSPPPSPYQY